jgi:WD40 repeat protein
MESTQYSKIGAENPFGTPAMTNFQETLFICSANRFIKAFSTKRYCLNKSIKNIDKVIVKCMIITPDQRFLITGSTQGSLKQWSTSDLTLVHNYGEVHQDSIKTMAATFCNLYIFTGSRDRHLKQWSLTNQTLIKDYGPIHKDAITAMAISPDNLFLFTGSHEGTISQWSIKHQTKVDREFPQIHADAITDMQMIPNTQARAFLSVSDSKHLKLFFWDINLNFLKDFGDVCKTGSVVSCCVTPNGQYVFTGSLDSTLKQWDLDAGKMVKDFGKVHNGNWITKVKVSPDGKRVYSADDVGLMKEWDLKRGSMIRNWGKIARSGIYGMEFMDESRGVPGSVAEDGDGWGGVDEMLWNPQPVVGLISVNRILG